jgi:cysteine-rich repeat protein
MVAAMSARCVVIAVCALIGCASPRLTKCPDVDCPKDEVCDGQGGCALPSQLSACDGVAACGPCMYQDRTGNEITGACDNGVCRPVLCGDGIVGCGEVCDVGPDNNLCTTCSADCKSNLTCGNNVVDLCKGEECDAGSANSDAPNSTCRASCKLPRCGDGIVDDTLLHEQCDAGSANADTPGAPCRTNCTLPRCGDGIVDTALGEVCDGGASNTQCTTCSADCHSDLTCGNGIVDSCKGEQCDAGAQNSDNPNAPCRANCTLPKCGDGVVDPNLGEECDAGAANANTPDAPCRTDCQLPRCGDAIVDPAHGEVCDTGSSNDLCLSCAADCRSNLTCGNGIVDSCKGEQCDAGALNSNNPNAPCRANCTLPRCGDGVVDPNLGEACDAGAMNSNAPNAPCRTNCQLPRCGDTIVDNTLLGEVCDLGATGNAACTSCSVDCKSNLTCGNGIVDLCKGEQCDAGGMNANTPNAPCRTNCKLPKCGDGIVDTAFGEQCDAGAANSNAPNAPCRPNCQLPRCGDGIVDTAAGEVCDAGALNTACTVCAADCKSDLSCGNGIVDACKGEQCDAGAANSNTPNAPCRTTCKLPKCGDGIVDNTTLGEQCDEGVNNANTPDHCRTNCQAPRCGDSIVDTGYGEVCDAGDANNLCTVCAADCKSDLTCGNGIVDLCKSEECDDGNGRAFDGCSACKSESAVVFSPGKTPHKRDSHAIAYDGARQRVVMYGGWTTGGNLNDTWEWDGTSWTQITTAHSPGTRLDASMAYDPVRHRIVLFGGYGANYTGVKADTWEYDGVDWTLKAPTASPPACAAAAFSFDANRGHMLLYGGKLGDGTVQTTTWDYNGTTWTSLMPAANPGPRAGARMAYDSLHNYVVLLGGGDNHLWTWNGSAWTDRGARTSLTNTGYDQLAMTFDANRQALVIWDGNQTNTFEWNGTSLVSIAGTPVAPAGSSYSYVEFAYDAIREQVIMFGGYGLVNGSVTDDYNVTWARSGTSWAKPPAFAEPPARQRSEAAYDPMRRRVVLFGGQTDSLGTSVNDTWEWDGTQWSSAAPTAKPPVRGGAMMSYDTGTRSVMLFGGDSNNSSYLTYADLWSYNGSTWSQPALSTGRSGVFNSGMVYDIAANRAVTFGGRDDGSTGGGTFQVLNTTWYWDATGWHQLSPVTVPTVREDFGIAYDTVRNRTVMYGGQDSSGNVTSEVSEWNGTTWANLSPPVAGPDPRVGLELVYNPDAARVLVFGNSDNLNGEDLWEWNGTAWTQRTVVGKITPRYREAVAYDNGHHCLLVFSGADSAGNSTTSTQRLGYIPNTSVEACTSAQIDYDNDGFAGCFDPDCWAVCTPLCPPGTACPSTSPRCGDGTCSGFEDCKLCPQDCGACTGKCGDFHCDSGETHAACPNDC